MLLCLSHSLVCIKGPGIRMRMKGRATIYQLDLVRFQARCVCVLLLFYKGEVAIRRCQISTVETVKPQQRAVWNSQQLCQWSCALVHLWVLLYFPRGQKIIATFFASPATVITVICCLLPVGSLTVCYFGRWYSGSWYSGRGHPCSSVLTCREIAQGMVALEYFHRHAFYDFNSNLYLSRELKHTLSSGDFGHLDSVE